MGGKHEPVRIECVFVSGESEKKRTWPCKCAATNGAATVGSPSLESINSRMHHPQVGKRQQRHCFVPAIWLDLSHIGTFKASLDYLSSLFKRVPL